MSIVFPGVVFAQSFLRADAGRADTTICLKDTLILGGDSVASRGNPPYTYSWLPAGSLSSSTVEHPAAFPFVSTTYYVTVTDADTSVTDSIHVIVDSQSPTPLIDAGNNITLTEGKRAVLHATGGYSYYWVPEKTLRYFNTSDPDAEPEVTTTYYVKSRIDGCINDSLTITIKPKNGLYFYNTFTPNGDKENDTWYIGNLDKSPQNKLSIFSRNGKLVYQAHPYSNDWNGKNEGEDVPEATYYYVLDPGNGDPVYKGSVTIIR